MAIGKAEEALKKADELDAPARAIGRTLASLVNAGIALERGQFATAEHLLIELEVNARDSGSTPLLSFVLLWRARTSLAQGEEEAAVVHLATARRLFSRPFVWCTCHLRSRRTPPGDRLRAGTWRCAHFAASRPN